VGGPEYMDATKAQALPNWVALNVWTPQTDALRLTLEVPRAQELGHGGVQRSEGLLSLPRHRGTHPRLAPVVVAAAAAAAAIAAVAAICGIGAAVVCGGAALLVPFLVPLLGHAVGGGASSWGGVDLTLQHFDAPQQVGHIGCDLLQSG